MGRGTKPNRARKREGGRRTENADQTIYIYMCTLYIRPGGGSRRRKQRAKLARGTYIYIYTYIHTPIM